MPDDETTFEALQARIRKTIDFLKTVPKDSVDGQEDKEIVLKMPAGESRSRAQAYVSDFVLPNFYFHVTTAYNILRHNGVPVGKWDFLGEIPLHKETTQ